MSFSKARIQRFNEVGSEAPPPGAYDPKFDSKIKGLAIEKKERFQDNKSVASGSTECNLSVSSRSTGNPAPAVFRTPQLPQKRLTAKPTHASCPKSKSKSKGSPSAKDGKSRYETEQEVADLKVECANKDKTIQEHEKHIEEMKEATRKLEMQLEDLRKKQLDVEEQHRKDIEAMAKLQQEVLTDHDEKYELEVKMLREQLLEVTTERECEIQARKAMEDDLKQRVAALIAKTATLEDELAKRKDMDKLVAELNEERWNKESEIGYLNKRIMSTEKRLGSSVKEVERMHREYEKVVNHLEQLENNCGSQIDALEDEKIQLHRCIGDLKAEKSELEMKLQHRQKVVLELQAQLSALQCELDELKGEYDKLVEDSNRQLAELRSNHAEEINKLKENFTAEKEAICEESRAEKSRRLATESIFNEISETNAFLTEELEDVQRLYKDINLRLKEAQQELENSNERHALILKKHKEDVQLLKDVHYEERGKLQQQLEDAREEYAKELEILTVARAKELEEVKEASARKIEEETKRMKERADKMVANAEAVTRETLAACRAESEERVKRVIAESDAKMSSMIREARAAVEEEMRLANERYEACLKRVESERAFLDEKLAQRDAEINRLSATLEELKSSAETQESFSQSLQIELDKAEQELAEKKEELRTLKEQMRAEAAEMVARRKRFEVVMIENQASVAALTQRLAQSHAEVEKLQKELKRGESCIDEHRDLLSAMRNNSQLVHEQVHSLMKELDAKRGLIEQLEAGSFKEFESIKSIFETKIDDLKQVAGKEIERLRSECEKKTEQNAELKKHLEQMAARLVDAQDMLVRLEEKCDAQTIEISKMELLNAKLEEQLKIQTRASKEERNLLRAQTEDDKRALGEANARLAELTAKVQSFDERDTTLISEQLEMERRRREAVEVEMTTLKENNEYLAKEYQAISEKYAEVIGHQNHKQRIKHVAQLKEKIDRLEQELQVKVKTIEQQQKTIERLKAEEKRNGHGKGKENVLPGTKSVHTTPVSSPHKALTPLRNRNE